MLLTRTCVCVSVCVGGRVEAVIGSLRRSVPTTSSSGVQLQFSLMTFLAQRPRCTAPAVTGRCVRRQRFSAQRPRLRKSPDSSYCRGAFTRAISASRARTHARTYTSVFPSLRLFGSLRLSDELHSLSGGLKRSLSMRIHSCLFLKTRGSGINQRRQAF